jgi:type I restriction enzyme S subunit
MPTDWEEVRLGDISEVKTGPFGSSLHASDYVSQGTPIITVEHLGEFRLRGEKAPLVGKKDATRLSSYVLRPGDLVFSRVGSIGRFGYVEELENGWLFSGRLLRLRIRQGHPRFLYFQMCGMKFISQIFKVAVGQTMPSLNTVLVGNLKVSFPPLREQEAIAEALSDADNAIESLDALIAKKRDVKQGVMQQLLTGRTRLPGFTGDWEEISIGSFAECKAGGTPSTSVPAYWGGDIRWMSSGELNMKRVREVAGRITQAGFENSSTQFFPAGSVLIGLAGQGKTRGTAAINLVGLTTNQSIAAIFPSDRHDSKFLFYVMETKYKELRDLSDGGGGRGGLNLTIIKDVRVAVPPLEEQMKISEVLWSMDDELEALTAQVSKLRMVKTGMMQDLLTGKVRLV